MVICHGTQLHILTKNNHRNKQCHTAQAKSGKASPLYQEYRFRKGTTSPKPGGICGKTYENGFDTFSCCNRLFAISSVGLFIILSSGSSLKSYTLLYFLPYITIFLKLARKLSYSCFNCFS